MFRDINGNKFKTRWISEFCGFMWGEGYVGIVRYEKKGKPFYRGQVSIQLREDDLSILEEIKSKLGGHIWKASPERKLGDYTCHQTYGWICTNKEELMRIVKVLDKGSFPSKKRKNIKLLKKYLNISKRIRNNNEIKERVNDLRLGCIKANSYSMSQQVTV